MRFLPLILTSCGNLSELVFVYDAHKLLSLPAALGEGE